jgi:putative tricarboxylic transport membrane protein
MNHDRTSASRGKWLRAFRHDGVSGLLIAAVGAFYLVEGSKIAQGASHAVVPPWGFPLFVGCGLTATGLLISIFAILKAARGRISTDGESVPDRIDWPSTLAAMGILIGYVGLFVVLGFIVSTTLMILALARVFGSRSILRDALYAIGFSVIAYAIFTYGIGVPLPAGYFSSLI